MPYIYFFESEIMKPILGFLLIICLVGCGKDTPTGASEEVTKGPLGLPVQAYWPNGQIKSEGEYLYVYTPSCPSWAFFFCEEGYERFKTGKWVEYDRDGQIVVEGEYKEGRKWNGKWVWYYENAQIKSEGNYKNGELDGKWVRYDEEGNITSERCYEMGKRVDCP